MPLFTETLLGWDRDLQVGPAAANSTALMSVRIETSVAGGIPVTAFEALDREDVQRLRTLCDEALS